MHRLTTDDPYIGSKLHTVKQGWVLTMKPPLNPRVSSFARTDSRFTGSFICLLDLGPVKRLRQILGRKHKHNLHLLSDRPLTFHPST